MDLTMNDSSMATDPPVKTIPPYDAQQSENPKHLPPPDPSEMTQEEIKKEKNKIFKNIVLISFCFLLNFNAFQTLSRLQSSLHRVDGMGTINQSVLYAALVLSCLVLPKIIINLVGHKWTIPLAFGGYITWMAANG